MRAALTPLAGAVGFVGLWWLAVLAGVVDPVLLPSPATTFRDTVEGLSRGRLLADLLRTVERTAYSFLIACAASPRNGTRPSGVPRESGATCSPRPADALQVPCDLPRNPSDGGARAVPCGVNSTARAATAIGVALLLGEAAPDAARAEAMLSDFSLRSPRASVSSGIEATWNEVVVPGQAEGWADGIALGVVPMPICSTCRASSPQSAPPDPPPIPAGRGRSGRGSSA